MSFEHSLRLMAAGRSLPRLSVITSKLSERAIEFADLITERGKILNPEYSIDRDQPTSRASPLIVIRTDNLEWP